MPKVTAATTSQAAVRRRTVVQARAAGHPSRSRRVSRERAAIQRLAALERTLLKGLSTPTEGSPGASQKDPMRSYPRYATLLMAATLTMLTTLGGCSQIGRAIDCDQMCEEFQTCIDGDIDTHRCADRCEDKADDNHALRKKLDECTDCLDKNYACGEIEDKCPACADVTEALL